MLLLGLVAFVIYVYFFINPSQVIGILSKTNLSIYAGAFAAYFMFALFSSFAWNRLLNSLSVKVSKRKTLLFTWVGLFFEATVPQLGWSGEVSKTYLLAKDTKLDAGKIGASVVGQKIFTMTITIVALSTGLGLVLLNYNLPPTAILIISTVLVLSILSLAIIYYVSLKSTATKTLLNWAIKIISFFRKRWNPQNFNDRAEEMLSRFHEGIGQLRVKPKALVAPIVFAVTGFCF